MTWHTHENFARPRPGLTTIRRADLTVRVVRSRPRHDDRAAAAPAEAAAMSKLSLAAYRARLPRRPDFPPDAGAICAVCADSRGCPNVSVCCGGQLTVNLVVPCPLDRPPAILER